MGHWFSILQKTAEVSEQGDALQARAGDDHAGPAGKSAQGSAGAQDRSVGLPRCVPGHFQALARQLTPQAFEGRCNDNGQ